MPLKFCLRKALPSDVPVLRTLIELSVRGLQANDYSPTQIDSALKTVYGVDSQLIADGTYFVVELGAGSGKIICACGGWSKRKTLYGGDQWTGREPELLDPNRDAAKIRAFFVHPKYTRRGLGTLILEACEKAAAEAGFTRFEMGATLTGIALYQARGYTPQERLEVPLEGGLSLPIVRMAKQI